VVFIVRNPIERAWSALKMLYRWKGDDVGQVDQGMIARYFDSPTYRLRGDYLRTIRVWRSEFGSDLRVFRYRRLVEDPRRFLEEVCSFLGVPGEVNASRLTMRSNWDAERTRMPTRVERLLRKQFRKSIEELDSVVKEMAAEWLSEESVDSH